MYMACFFFPLPVGVEDSGSVATEQRDALWELSGFVEGDDSKGTTTAGLPIEREVFGVNLYRRAVRSTMGRNVRGRCGWHETDLD